MAAASGRSRRSAMAAPMATTDRATPISTNGSSTPTMASAPPTRPHQNEGARHEPERMAAQVLGEDAHGHHDEHMVEAADRMQESMREPVRVPDAPMGESRRCYQSHRHQDEPRHS